MYKKEDMKDQPVIAPRAGDTVMVYWDVETLNDPEGAAILKNKICDTNAPKGGIIFELWEVLFVTGNLSYRVIQARAGT